jgi:tRNA (cytidine/uridine-2'-O-)-methyltransferase
MALQGEQGAYGRKFFSSNTGALRMPMRPALDLRLALLEPERPHNLGMALRLAACLGVGLDVIEPCAFPLDDRRIRQGALDYGAHLAWTRHASLDAFLAGAAAGRRLILLSTRSSDLYHRFTYRPDDILMVGNERAGAPAAVHALAAARVRIPLAPGLRSLNLVTAAAIVLGEVMRQTGGFERLTEVE